VHFKTNGSVNDWGFRMIIVPTISSQAASREPKYRDETFKPRISSKGHSYSGGAAGSKNVPIHERLYAGALEKLHEVHNQNVQNLSDQLQGLDLKPWEEARNIKAAIQPGSAAFTNNRTHVGKNLLGPALNDLLILDGDPRTVAVSETGDVSTLALWRALSSVLPLEDAGKGGDGEGDGDGDGDGYGEGGGSSYALDRMKMSEL
jgi:hypothetical protein